MTQLSKFVLLFEDDHLQVKLISDLLKYQLGIDVKATDSLEEAFVLARKNPALIISDVCLVKSEKNFADIDKSGILFAESIKSSPPTCNIPLIMRSSMPLSYFHVTLQDTKADIFLDKSISNAEFLQVVKRLLNADEESESMQPLHCA